MKIRIKRLHPDAIIPHYAHENGEDVGLDLYSIETTEIPPLDHRIIHTGLAIEIPKGYELQIRSKSGLAAKHSLFVLNSPGTIDPGYRGELLVILYNLSKTSYIVEKHTKIAQAILNRIEYIELIETNELSPTIRDTDKFGSTGLKPK